MKVLFLTMLLTTCLLAQDTGLQKLRNTADETRQLSDVTQKTTYSLGAVLGGVTILSPKFVAANIFDNMHLQ